MLLLRLKSNENDEDVVARLGAAGIEVQSLSSHYVGRHREQGLLLSFAGFTDKELRAAAKKLVETL
jgi:DNA-binding transcriptional MocR family regulator